MKLETLVNSVAILNELLNKNMKPKAALRVSLTVKGMEPAFEIYKESEKKLFETFGTTRTDPEKGDVIEIPADKVEEFSKQRFDLLQEEVDVKVHKIAVDDLGDDVTLKPIEMAAIEWMFSDFDE